MGNKILSDCIMHDVITNINRNNDMVLVEAQSDFVYSTILY